MNREEKKKPEVYEIYLPEGTTNEKAKELQEQVEDLSTSDKPLNCIFVVSGNFDVISEIVRYICYSYGLKNVEYISYLGWESQSIISDLFLSPTFSFGHYNVPQKLDR